MSNQQWQLVKEYFSEERQYIDGFYYRLRTLAEDEYELAVIHGGVCGENIYHPRMKVKETKGMLVPLSMYDNYSFPVVNLSYEDAPERLTDELQSLLQQFLQAKELI